MGCVRAVGHVPILRAFARGSTPPAGVRTLGRSNPVPTPVRLAVKRSGGGRVFLTESTGETRVEVALEAAFWRITAPPSRTKR